MRPILLACAALWLASPSASHAAAPAGNAGKPNFVVIFIDDMGYGDIGPFGSKLNRTPHLDRMAAEGMKLTSFYAAPVCSVSRAQMMTGCYGARVSVPGVYFPAGPDGLHPQEDTIADLLKPQGYATMCIGKWHLGDQPEFLPTKQGFDHYLGIPYSNDMQRKSLETGQRVVPLVRDDKVAELLTDEAQSTVTERYTDEAVKFIREHATARSSCTSRTPPCTRRSHPGSAFQGKSANGRFGDWVEEVDWSVGRVLDTLRELKLDREHAGDLHQRQRPVAGQGQGRRRGRAPARRQRQHLGRRRARADHRLVARPDRRGKDVRCRRRHDRPAAHADEPGGRHAAGRARDRRTRHRPAAARPDHHFAARGPLLLCRLHAAGRAARTMEAGPRAATRIDGQGSDRRCQAARGRVCTTWTTRSANRRTSPPSTPTWCSGSRIWRPR